MAARTSGVRGISVGQISLLDESWLRDVASKMLKYEDKVLKKGFDPAKHLQYLEGFCKLKNKLLEKVDPSKQKNEASLFAAIFGKLQQIKDRHKEIQSTIPHFPYVASSVPLKDQIKKIYEFLEKYQAVLKEPKIDVYDYLKKYRYLKTTMLMFFHSASELDPHWEGVKKLWIEVRVSHLSQFFIQQMKLVKQMRDPSSYNMMLRFRDNCQVKSYFPKTPQELKSQMSAIASIVSDVGVAQCDFIYNASFEDAQRKWSIIQGLPESSTLMFRIAEESPSTRFIVVKPEFRKCMENLAFVNGQLKGYRSYPDRTEEWGVFDSKWGNLKQGIKEDAAGNVQFINPVEVFRWDLSSQESTRIIECRDQLELMKRYFVGGSARCRFADATVPNFLLNASLRTSGNFKIKDVLEHPFFQKFKEQFIALALERDEWESVRLLNFSNQALSDFLDMIDITRIDPLQIRQPKTDRNLITQVAYFSTSENGGKALMEKLSVLFPDVVQGLNQEIAFALLEGGIEHGYDMGLVQHFVDTYQMDAFHRIWMETVLGRIPECIITAFPEDEQCLIQEAAYSVGNPHIHLPPKREIKPEDYTVNLLCLGDELKSPESASRIADWILANPGTTLNAWFDGRFLVFDELKKVLNSLHQRLAPEAFSKLVFKNARKIEIVKDGPELFPLGVPLRARLYLIQALIAEETLHESKSQYYVSATIDRQPLSLHELFDRKTVDLLDVWGFVIPGRKGAYEGVDSSFQIWNKANEVFLNSVFETSIKALFERWELQKQETEKTDEYLFQAMVVSLCLELGMHKNCNLPSSDRLMPDISNQGERSLRLAGLLPKEKLELILLHDLESISQTRITRRGEEKEMSLIELLRFDVPKKALPPLLSSSVAASSSAPFQKSL